MVAGGESQLTREMCLCQAEFCIPSDAPVFHSFFFLWQQKRVFLSVYCCALLIFMCLYVFFAAIADDDCSPNPCVNGGVCTDTGSNAVSDLPELL